MKAAPILIVHASGTNRDGDAAQAIQLAGGDPQIAHVNELRAGRVKFGDHAGVLIPGGFSYGDALGAGQRLALELRLWFGSELSEVVAAGKPVLGICNGFQVLVNAGILPGGAGGGTSSRIGVSARRVTLTRNARGRFECRWVTLRVEPNVRSTWLQSIRDTIIRCPVAHGEGRFVSTDDSVVDDLETEGLVAFRYQDCGSMPVDSTDSIRAASGAYPANPNGSVADIAGICDHSGAVVGLMPHPEDHVLDWQRPNGGRGASGLPLFEAFVAAARQ